GFTFCLIIPPLRGFVERLFMNKGLHPLLLISPLRGLAKTLMISKGFHLLLNYSATSWLC
ncbi:MAG TPA: hypothetical protein PK041_05895, partial [Kaistella sp.]|nr:hypothetical protein [Kaistella sp.]